MCRGRKRRVAFFVAYLLAVSGLSAWDSAGYSTTSAEFFQRADVRRRIDFSHPDAALLDAAVFYETNLRRVEAGLPALTHLDRLDRAARSHAEDMVKYNYFSHDSPLAGQRTVQDRLASVGISEGVQGENIARGFGLEYDSGRAVYPPQDTGAGFRYALDGPDLPPRTYAGLAKNLLDQWMNSPDHRSILLSRDFRFLGGAVVPYKAVNFFNMDYFMAVADFSSSQGSEPPR